MTLPETSPLPVVQILSEVARLHWRHVLVFLASAALYAIPATLILSPLAETLVELQAKQTPTPALMDQLTTRGFYALLVIPLLSGALFWFWVRLTLLGARAGWRNDGAGRSLLAVLHIAGLMVMTLLVATIGLLPATLLLGLFGQSPVVQFLTFLVVTFGTCLAFAVFSRRLVEAALEFPRAPSPQRPAIRMDQHLRLAALFAAATFGLFLAQTIVNLALTSLGAVLSANVATGILSTATITVYASIHAIVYRLRTPPPQPL